MRSRIVDKNLRDAWDILCLASLEIASNGISPPSPEDHFVMEILVRAALYVTRDNLDAECSAVADWEHWKNLQNPK